jgi:hypothetical protein
VELEAWALTPVDARCTQGGARAQGKGLGFGQIVEKRRGRWLDQPESGCQVVGAPGAKIEELRDDTLTLTTYKLTVWKREGSTLPGGIAGRTSRTVIVRREQE